MAQFVIGTPIETADPTIQVDNPLPAGKHRFQLIVVEDQGNRSAPSIFEVIVKDQNNPTAILMVTPLVGDFGTPSR